MVVVLKKMKRRAPLMHNRQDEQRSQHQTENTVKKICKSDKKEDMRIQ